jgi:hypothetical protein
LSRCSFTIQKAYTEYYKALPEKLAVAHALACREPTKLEIKVPPSTANFARLLL